MRAVFLDYDTVSNEDLNTTPPEASHAWLDAVRVHRPSPRPAGAKAAQAFAMRVSIGNRVCGARGAAALCE